MTCHTFNNSIVVFWSSYVVKYCVFNKSKVYNHADKYNKVIKLVFYDIDYVNDTIDEADDLPAGGIAEVPLAEDDPVEGGRELEVDDHPRLLAGHVQPRDLGHVARATRLLTFVSQRLYLATYTLHLILF